VWETPTSQTLEPPCCVSPGAVSAPDNHAAAVIQQTATLQIILQTGLRTGQVPVNLHQRTKSATQFAENSRGSVPTTDAN
jgi:hypothetical protein